MRIQVNNDENGSEAFYVRHDGTGKLASLNNTDAEKFSVLNNGNTMTAGTMTVKGNKGIVRSSTSTQMRMETINVQMEYFNMPEGNTDVQNISFSTAFSSPPVVSVGNLLPGYSGPCWKMVMSVDNVTTTGCTINMYNASVGGNPDVSGTWKILVVGAE
jgi:hypothetical protein